MPTRLGGETAGDVLRFKLSGGAVGFISRPPQDVVEELERSGAATDGTTVIAFASDSPSAYAVGLAQDCTATG